MIVTLIENKFMHKITLPQDPIGNYWICDKTGQIEKKLVNIEGKAGNWQITSNRSVKIIDLKYVDTQKYEFQDNKKIIKQVNLKEYDMYGICFGKSKKLYILCCLPIYEKNLIHLNIKNTKEIFIGNTRQNHIIYKNPLICSNHLRIFYNNKKWMIENKKNAFGVFANNRVISETPQFLSNGDVIFVLGLKIIMMGNSLFIHNPKDAVICNSSYFSLNNEKYDFKPVKNEHEDNETVELYSEDYYFSRAPRITNLIEREKIKIDSPPQVQNKEETPALLMIGSTLCMGIMMVFSMFSTISGRANGKSSIATTIFSVLITLLMLASMILFPILSLRYEKEKKKKYEQKRQDRYKRYLNSKLDVITKIMSKQKRILTENFSSVEECEKIIIRKTPRLWERKIESPDFLSVRLGIGDIPLDIDIQYPEESFEMEDDNLREILQNIVKKSRIIPEAPITISLAQKNISALISPTQEISDEFMQRIILQLVTFQSYEDLKLVFLLKNDQNWEYAKMLPHVWDNNKQIRFFADNYDDMKEISDYLVEEFKNRIPFENIDYRSFMPYYLIITDDFNTIKNLKIVTEILKSKVNFGFSMLFIANNLVHLPNECKTFISLNNPVSAMLFENEISSSNQKQIQLDKHYPIYFDRLCQIISNIPIRYAASESMLLPNTYTFLEMYDVGLIEQLNVLDRWKKNDSTLSLKAPIGIDGSGMPIVLNIHEKAHGPHGLIAGSTGSGKSEFIITYILSLAINYHPDDVSFLLIDYKGGGLAGAFEKRGTKLPHLAGTITNIDTIGLQRSLTSIQSELRKRQVMFNEARNITDEGTIDIYKYQKLYHNGVVEKPIPHLLIICDEFAELKQQQEGFMNELMSVSRIGRSLGVHLILATQKPAGIVNEQIRSNSKFAVCLKVQSAEDSKDVIKKVDAANLKNAGQFYLQVGNDDYFVLGQSAWAGAPYFPSSTTKKKVDNSIAFISNIGTPIKVVDDSTKKLASANGEQLTNIVNYICGLAKRENISTEPLWLENIPETIFLGELKEKYNRKTPEHNIYATIGEFDDPFNQRQGLANINFSTDGNVAIYGNAESGKETLLSTIVYDLMTSYSAEKVWIYILDFGTESLKIYKDSPHVGDVILLNHSEKLMRFFGKIQKEIQKRKNILSNYNGDYDLYLKSSSEPMPMIVAILNNFEAFSESYGNEYEDLFLSLTREGLKCGIVFVVTASAYNDMRYRLTQNFKKKIALKLNNEDDYFNILDKVGRKRPSPLFGRGLISSEEGDVYEFQTAKITNSEEYNLHIEEMIKTLKEVNNTHAKQILVLPYKVTFANVQKYLQDITSVPIGLIEKNLKVCTYNFKKNFLTLLTSKNMEDAIEFSLNIIEEISHLNDVNLTVFDVEKSIQDKQFNLNDAFQEFIDNIDSQNNNKYNICVILGIDKFLNYLNNDKQFYEMLKKAEEARNYSFLLIENVNRFKNRAYNEWYKNYVNGDSGIFVGNGIDDQYLIGINDRKNINNKCGRSFGYIINQGTPTLIKLLEIKENNDE